MNCCLFGSHQNGLQVKAIVVGKQLPMTNVLNARMIAAKAASSSGHRQENSGGG